MPRLFLQTAFLTGIEPIDAEHRLLVDRFNELVQAVDQGEPPDVVDLVLRALIAETRRHFANEERLLEAHDYADLEAHRAEHAELLRQIERYEARYRAGTLALNQHMMALIKDWLIVHILVDDKAFAAHLTAVPDAD